MIVLIDGYNVIKQLYRSQQFDIHRQRDHFIKILSAYKQLKKDAISDVIVVFDAGPLQRATREVRQGVVVIFSGQARSADDWIIDWIERHKGAQIVLVTNDQGIIKRAQQWSSVVTVRVNELYELLQSALQKKHLTQRDLSDNQSTIMFSDDSIASQLEGYERHDDVFDDMMYAEKHVPVKDHSSGVVIPKKLRVVSEKLSKKDRKKKTSLKKLSK